MKKFESATQKALLTIMVATAFFVVGFTWREISAAGASPASVKDAIAAAPGRVGLLVDDQKPTETKLPVRTVYQETVNTIMEQFYPEASTSETVVLKTPTNSVSGAVEKVEPSLDTKQLTYMAIRGILASLDDQFTGFLDPSDYKKMREENEGNFVGIGAQLQTNKQGQVYVKEPLPDNPAIKAGVKKGDVILKVDNKSVAGMEIDEVVKLIRGPESTSVTLTLSRNKDQKPVVLTIKRQVVEYRMVEHEMLDNEAGIGWLLLRQFNSKADEQMDKALDDLEAKRIKGLVLDLRGNPGGLLESAVDIGSRFIESGPVVIIQQRGGSREQLLVEPSKHDHSRDYQLVVLVDGMSASASEIVAGAIKDNKVGMLVGNKTFGKGRVQTIVPLPGDSAVRITTAKYLTPAGIDIHKHGIDPDVEVNALEELPEEAEDNEDRMKYDPQLQKAVELLRNKIVKNASGTSQAKRN